MKLVDIVRDANSNLLRSKARTILTVIAIFIGAFTLTVTNGIGSGVSKYIDQQLGNLGAEDVIVVQARMDDDFTSGPKKYEEAETGTSANSGFGVLIPMMNDQDISEITAVSGIVSAEPMLAPAPDYIVGPNNEKYQVMTALFITGTNLELTSGELPDNESAQNEITLPLRGSAVARIAKIY